MTIKNITKFFIFIIIIFLFFSCNKKNNSSNKTNINNKDIVQVPSQVQIVNNVTVKISVFRKTAQGAQVRINPDFPFRSGDKIRLGISSTKDGYLYLLLKGSSGSVTQLFPDKRIGGGLNTIKAGQEMIIPSEGWFSFDKNPGTEMLYAYYSETPEISFFQNIEIATGYKNGKPNKSIESQVLNILKNRSLITQKKGKRDIVNSGHSGQDPFLILAGQGALAGILELSHE